MSIGPAAGAYFSEGQSHFDFFPGVKCFFPVENSPFGRPKLNSRRFKKWKAKKKKKKVLTSFYDISYFKFFHRIPFYNNFLLFLFFSIFTPFPFFLPSFFPIRQQKIPGQKSQWGALCPPVPTPPVTPLASGVARAFSGGRLTHPEGPNEEENKYSLRKNKRNWSKFEEKWGKWNSCPPGTVRLATALPLAHGGGGTSIVTCRPRPTPCTTATFLKSTLNTGLGLPRAKNGTLNT